MKKGDKVRFLSETGGGVVSGFKDKFTVLVEDEDGFEIPMLVSDCVVIDTDDYNIAKVNTLGLKEEEKPLRRQPKPEPEEEPEPQITFVPAPQERSGGDQLNVYLAFVPQEEKEPTDDPAFDIFFINDSNYFLNFACFSSGGAFWRIRFSGVAEPNTKLLMETFRRSELQDFERLSVQMIAYKRDKPFALKPALNVELRPDATKFYKLHTFRENDFFDEPSLLLDVVRDDKPMRTVFVNAHQLQDELNAKKQQDERPAVQPARKKEKKEGPLEVDLHAGELLDSVKGLEPKDILDCQLRKFNEVMQERLKEKGAKIVFIHGKGNGVLRNEILKELRYKYKSCLYQDASFREYGFGATLVTIK